MSTEKNMMALTLHEMQVVINNLQYESVRLKQEIAGLQSLNDAYANLLQKYEVVCACIHEISDALDSDKPARHVTRTIADACDRAIASM